MKNRDQNKQAKKSNLEGNRLYRENETSTITTKLLIQPREITKDNASIKKKKKEQDTTKKGSCRKPKGALGKLNTGEQKCKTRRKVWS